MKKTVTGVFVERDLLLVGKVIDVIIKNDNEFDSDDEFITHLNRIGVKIISDIQKFDFEPIGESK